MRTKLTLLPAVLVSLSLSLAGTGCMTDTADEDPDLDEASQALNNRYLLTTYFNNAAHTTEVWICVGPSTCSQSFTICHDPHPGDGFAAAPTSFKTLVYVDC